MASFVLLATLDTEDASPFAGEVTREVVYVFDMVAMGRDCTW